MIILTSLAHSFPKRLQASRPQALEGPRRGREALRITVEASLLVTLPQIRAELEWNVRLPTLSKRRVEPQH